MISGIFKNNGDGSFSELVSISLRVQYGTSTWADLDNDGDLDILIAGLNDDMGEETDVYLNNGDNGFALHQFHTFENVHHSVGACGDYDKDGDLDVILAGTIGSSSIARVYKNNTLPLNTQPQKPSGLTANTTGGSVVLT